MSLKCHPLVDCGPPPSPQVTPDSELNRACWSAAKDKRANFTKSCVFQAASSRLYGIMRTGCEGLLIGRATSNASGTCNKFEMYRAQNNDIPLCMHSSTSSCHVKQACRLLPGRSCMLYQGPLMGNTADLNMPVHAGQCSGSHPRTIH